MKNEKFELKTSDKPELSITNSELEERIHNLKKFLNNNQKEIRKINKNTLEEEMNIIDKHFNDNLKELEVLEETIQKLDNINYDNEIKELESMYREIQHNYLSVQMNRITVGMEEISKSINDMQNEIERSFDNVKEKTNNITGNILFSVIAIVLGISLVSAMVTGVEKLNPNYLLVYFTSISWIAITVMGLAYLLLRQYDKKSKSILFVIGFATIILALVMYFTFK